MNEIEINTTVTDLWESGWRGRFDKDGQPINDKGQRIHRLLQRINREGLNTSDGPRVYVPRLMGDIPRVARSLLRARKRSHTFWQTEVIARVRRIHDLGGLAFARDRGYDGEFDVWRTVITREGDLGFSREQFDLKPREEPLENVAVAVCAREARQTNRELGLALTKAYDRSTHGDISHRLDVVRTCFEWAIREHIRRSIRLDRISSGIITGPTVLRIHIADVGEWTLRREEHNWQWSIIAEPGSPPVEIHIPPPRATIHP